MVRWLIKASTKLKTEKKEIKKERRDEIKEKKKLIPLIKKKGRRSINKLVAISLQLS